MIIDHPLLGPRDSQEFTYLGDATLLNRPDWKSENSSNEFFEYLYFQLVLIQYLVEVEYFYFAEVEYFSLYQVYLY